MKLFPEHIKCVSVIAPASGTPRERLDGFLALMDDWNVKVKLAPNLFACDDMSYLAASAAARAADFAAAAADPEVDAIIPMRGGFGCAHLPELVDLKSLPDKPVFGYSDLTCLHLALLKYGRMTPVAAPMAVKMPELLTGESPENELNRRCFRLAMMPEGTAADPVEVMCRKLKNIGARGPATPCNLSVLCSLSGTPFMPDMRGRMLILEDINEPLYKLDRMLTQLRQSGVLSGVSGVIFGEFTDCGNDEERDKLFARFTGGLDCAAAADFPFGHGAKLASLNFKRFMRLEASGRVILE